MSSVADLVLASGPLSHCVNSHLIADHLQWFTQTDGEPRTIEEIVAAKGGRVRRGSTYSDGQGGETIEIEADSDETAQIPETNGNKA